MTTQDFVKGVDLTGLSEVSATELNQLIDIARPASDKGLLVTSTDTAADTPDVPDPTTAISGTTPSWWVRYLWVRFPYTGGTHESPLVYAWNPLASSDATYLKWQRVDAETLSLADDVAEALQNSADALTAANTATGLVTDLQTDVVTVQNELDAAEATIQANTNRIDLLENSGTGFTAGDLRWSAKQVTYSTSSNQGWLLCNGGAVSRTTFTTLFAAIGTTYGAGDGSTTFNVPDCLGRTLYGAGTGDGLTARTAGQEIGSETLTLTPENVGQLDVAMTISEVVASASEKYRIDSLTFNDAEIAMTGPLSDTAYLKNQTEFSLISPGTVAYCYIKT